MSFKIYRMLKWPLVFCAIFACCTEKTTILDPVLENSPPEFLMNYPDSSVVAGRPITLQVIVKDNDGDLVTLSTAIKPAGSTFDSLRGEFYWKPDLELDVIGSHALVFTASDNDTTVVDSIVIDVTAGASPVFTCKDSAKTNAGFAMQFQLKATDADKDILKYFARTFPDTGIKIDSLSGLLIWKPSAALVNTSKTCVVFVTDGLTEDTLPLILSILAPTKLLVPEVFWKIQPAVDAAQSGDTVFVDTGTYSENVDFKGKVIVLISRFSVAADPAMIDKTIIDGMDKAPVIMINNCGAGTVVSGFTLQSGRGNGNQGGGVHINKTPALIEHCVIKDSRSEGG